MDDDGTGQDEASSAAPPELETLAARCAAAPSDPRPRVELGLALLRANRAAEALIWIEQALALAPGFASAIDARERLAAALQAGEPGLVALEVAAALQPQDAGAQLALGEAYAAADRAHDAERQFKRALVLGRAREAHADLAVLYLSVGMMEAAEHHAHAALTGEDRGPADDAAIVMAHQTLASVLRARGEVDAAERRLDLAYGRQSLFRQAVEGAAFTTLVLVSRKAGNIPYAALTPPDRFDRLIWYMEHAHIEQLANAPPFAVVLNAIGDPDIAEASRARVAAVLAACACPALNRPDRIRATQRHQLPDTLSGIADVVAPRTIRLGAGALSAQGLASAVAQAGLEPPVLVRPAASHGGAGLELAQTGDELTRLMIVAGQDYYVTQFQDYRSADGYFRKYRVIFVDRRAFPYHLAIGRHWMVHHVTSEMADDPMRKAEELRFLADPAGVLGPRALAAIEAIGRRIDLDYAGLDFSVLEDGRVLVFEANATMLTHLEDENGPFAAKNPFVRPIIDAFQAHLEGLALAHTSAPRT